MLVDATELSTTLGLRLLSIRVLTGLNSSCIVAAGSIMLGEARSVLDVLQR